MSYYDDNPPEEKMPEGRYQLMLIKRNPRFAPCLGEQAFNMGVFTPQQLSVAVTFLAAAHEEAQLQAYDGEVSNVLEAWGSPDYVVWALPMDPTMKCWQYGNDGLTMVTNGEDPR